MTRSRLVFALAVWTPCLSGAEHMVVKRAYAKLREGPGSFYEVVGLVKKGAVLEVAQRDRTGRWLRLEKVLGRKGQGSPELEVLSQADAEHPLWVARVATAAPKRRANLSKLAGLCGELRINEATCAAAIRGMDNDAIGLINRQALSKEVAEYILSRKFTPAQYVAFRDKTLPSGQFAPLAVEDDRAEEAIEVLTADKAGLLVLTVSLKLSGALKDRIVRDAGFNRYVNMVATLVGEASDRYDITYRAVIIETPRINSFSAPGGFIVITTGLLEACQSEAQLAAALAHEIAHIARDHGLKERRNVARELGADVMGAFRELEESVPDPSVFRLPEFEELEDMASWFYSVTIAKPRRQREENEADTFGLVYVYKAGYDPSEMIGLLDRIGRSKGYFGGQYTMVNHATAEERMRMTEWALSRFKLRGNAGRTFADRYTKQIQAWRARHSASTPSAPRRP